MKAFAILSALGALMGFASANTVFSEIGINGADLGHGIAVRVPSANSGIKDLTSNDLVCNTNFIQPVSTVIAQVPAGAQVTAHFHRTSAGYLGPSPSEPLDPTNKGPVLAYLARVPDATQTDVTGLSWFKRLSIVAFVRKIWQDGLDPNTHQWGSDILFINQGNATFTIPPCLAAGQYLLRVEAISLSEATSYPGAEFFMSCAQLEITGGGDTLASGVSFPGAYKTTDPGIVTNIFFDTTYTAPGPAVFQC